MRHLKKKINSGNKIKEVTEPYLFNTRKYSIYNNKLFCISYLEEYAI